MVAESSPHSVSSAAPSRARPAVWRSSGVIAVVTLLSRICGLIRDSVTARYFGAGEVADAFFLAFRIPNLLRRLVAEGSLATAFVPVFSSALGRSEAEAKKTVGEVMGFCLLLTAVLAALGCYFSAELTAAFAPGFSAGFPDGPTSFADGNKLVLTTELLQMMFPYIILVSVLALTSSALNSLGVFGIPAAAPIILNLCIIASVVLWSSRVERPVFTLAWGVLLGGAVSILPLWALLARRGYSLRPRWPFRSKAVAEVAKLMIPAVLGSSVYQLMVLLNSIFASLLSEGTVAWLYYADRLFQFPLGVFSISLATAVLPAFAGLAAERNDAGLRDLLERSLGWVHFITLPAATGLFVLALPITQICYQYQQFSYADSVQTSRALQAYALGLWSLSCHGILVRAFLAKRNTTTPAVVSGLTLLLYVIFSLALMGPPEVVAESGYAAWLTKAQQSVSLFSLSHAGLALAGSLAGLCSFLFLALRLPSIGLSCRLGPLLNSFLRAAFASSLMALALLALKQVIPSALLLVPIAVCGGAGVYFLAAYALRSPEANEAFGLLMEYAKRRNSAGQPLPR